MPLVNPAGGHGGEIGQESMLHGALGQRLDEGLAVALAGETPVQADDHPPVGPGADQATKALAKTQNGIRQRVLVEGVVVGFAAGGEDGIVGHGERQPGDDHAERIP